MSIPEAEIQCARRVLALNTDESILALLAEWLSGRGYEVMVDCGEAACDGFDLIVVDVPFPRQGGQEMVKRVAAAYPGSPILAISSNFFPDVKSDGAVARALGVASVLPKPLTRDLLTAAVDQL